jgi:hypothetical protein
MGGIAYVDNRKLEVDELAKWLEENTPLCATYHDLSDALIKHLYGADDETPPTKA